MASESDNEKEPAVAGFPFDNTNADSDLVLRSSDNIDFYVHKLILKVASPIFLDKFVVAQNGLPDKAEKCHSDLPVVPLAEPSNVIDTLLRMCYPVVERKPDSLVEVTEILKAALKYKMPKIIANTQAALLGYAVTTEPVSVYAIACTLNLEHEASVAAVVCKERFHSESKPLCFPETKVYINPEHAQRNGHGHFAFCNGFCLPFSSTDAGMVYQDSMRQATAGHFYRLLQYFSGEATTFCSPPREIASDDRDSSLNSDPLHENYSFTSFPNPDITIQSLDGISIPAHKNILLFASATSILDQLEDSSTKSEGGLPTIHLEEDGRTLATLLQLCYPFADAEVTQESCSASLAAGVWRAAEKYEMPKVAHAAKSVMMRHIKDDPVQVFFSTSRYGYVEEAELAATQCLSMAGLDGPSAYRNEMEFVSAEVYFNLLKRWHESKVKSGTQPVSMSSVINKDLSGKT